MKILLDKIMAFQSTLLRRSDVPGISGGVDCNISIHAPAKERRYMVKKDAQHKDISIHAPAKERLQQNII